MSLAHRCSEHAAATQSPLVRAKPCLPAVRAFLSRTSSSHFNAHRWATARVSATGTTKNAEPAKEALEKSEKYDVYVNEPKRLKEGEEKHVISVFVADEAGLINRVAGVFARRGANIESLAVGLTVDKALFTIVMTGSASFVANLVKQLNKLVKVRYVEDVTSANKIEREMLLVKLRVPPGPARTEVLQLAQIFRARVVDVSERSITLCTTGDPGKCAALQKVMSKFGIIELARTGRICLKRGETLLEPGSTVPENQRRAAPISDAAASSVPFTNEEREGDVYMVDEDDWGPTPGFNNLLEPTYQQDAAASSEAHTLNIEVQDQAGVLNQVTGVFARRGYNVQSLAVGPSERPGMSRICMVVPGSQQAVDKLLKQLNKLVAVENVTDLTHQPFVNRELMLVKVRCTASQRGELRDLVSIFRASIVDVGPTTVAIEILGKEDKMRALTDLLEPYGILEIARTGRVAMLRDSGVDTKYLEQMSAGRIW